MIQLRYLKDCELDITSSQRQPNGALTETYRPVAQYQVQMRELTDDISASIYGADVNNMYRVSSPYQTLEYFLKSKMNRSSDNISRYTLVIDGERYRIRAVRIHWADIELI